MTTTYRDMHKINEKAESLLKELERYRDHILGDISYYDHLETQDAWQQAYEYYGDEESASANAHEFYDEDYETPFDSELREINEIITTVKKLTSAKD